MLPIFLTPALSSIGDFGTIVASHAEVCSETNPMSRASGRPDDSDPRRSILSGVDGKLRSLYLSVVGDRPATVVAGSPILGPVVVGSTHGSLPWSASKFIWLDQYQRCTPQIKGVKPSDVALLPSIGLSCQDLQDLFDTEVALRNRV